MSASRLFLLALAIGPPTALAQAAEPLEPVSALREGNRLYREGRLEEARDAYLAGYRADDLHPVLAYNIGATLHRLGDLPGAILWYRRAARINPADPWLGENLEEARRTLGLQPYPAPGISGAASRHRQALLYLAALLAWAGVGLWIARPREGLRRPALLIGAGVLIFAATHLADLAAPRAAVVVDSCSGDSVDLPPGSEVWVTEAGKARLGVVAGDAAVECPRSALSFVVEKG